MDFKSWFQALEFMTFVTCCWLYLKITLEERPTEYYVLIQHITLLATSLLHLNEAKTCKEMFSCLFYTCLQCYQGNTWLEFIQSQIVQYCIYFFTNYIQQKHSFQNICWLGVEPLILQENTKTLQVIEPVFENKTIQLLARTFYKDTFSKFVNYKFLYIC